jgi:hypothetical protein
MALPLATAPLLPRLLRAMRLAMATVRPVSAVVRLIA